MIINTSTADRDLGIYPCSFGLRQRDLGRDQFWSTLRLICGCTNYSRSIKFSPHALWISILTFHNVCFEKSIIITAILMKMWSYIILSFWQPTRWNSNLSTSPKRGANGLFFHLVTKIDRFPHHKSPKYNARENRIEQV